MPDSITFVEDDPTIRELVAKKLRGQGYAVAAYDSIAPCLEAPLSDLYILDVLLEGGESGLALCERLRKRSSTVPILILSALSEPSHRIEGLQGGADDYLTKPFEMEELLLRVRGMLKRRSWYRDFPGKLSVFSWDDCAIDFESLQGHRGKVQFSLSQKEAMVLKLLIENEGRATSRDEILDAVWGYHAYPTARTVDNFIVRLRKYFEENPQAPKHIHSVRGLGYKFTL